MSTLVIENVESGYGEVQICWGASITLREGKLTTLLGSNGAGKTTLLRAVMGLLPCWKGSVRLDDVAITRLSPHQKAELGLVLVPEGRQLFSSLTVLENLEMGATPRRARAAVGQTIDQVFSLFPRLKERRAQLAGTLSGGEQQMVAIGRALMARPRLLMLDEPSLGLAPVVVGSIFANLAAINRDGLTILLVEQNVLRALKSSHRAYVLENGTITLSGASATLLADERIKRAYLGR